MSVIKKVSKYIYFKGLDILNVDETYFNKIVQNKHLVILNLHRVSDEINPFYPSLSLYHFEYLLSFVVKKFNVITFNEIEHYKESVKPNLILSFDDGFYDFFENAVPLMQKYSVRANLNIIPQCVETGYPVWDVKLGDYLQQVPNHIINNFDFGTFNMKLSSKNKSQFGLALTRHLKSMTYDKRTVLWDKLEKVVNPFEIHYTKMLSVEDIKHIAKIHEVGVHSFSHESMALETNEFFKDDFFKCQAYFSNVLHIPLNIYTFPSGSYRDEQCDFLKKNGIEHILLGNDKYSSNETSIYSRFTFYGDSVSEIKMRALGWNRK